MAELRKETSFLDFQDEKFLAPSPAAARLEPANQGANLIKCIARHQTHHSIVRFGMSWVAPFWLVESKSPR